MFTVGLLDHYSLDNCLLARTLLGAIVNLQMKWLEWLQFMVDQTPSLSILDWHDSLNWNYQNN